MADVVLADESGDTWIELVQPDPTPQIIIANILAVLKIDVAAIVLSEADVLMCPVRGAQLPTQGALRRHEVPCHAYRNINVWNENVLLRLSRGAATQMSNRGVTKSSRREKNIDLVLAR